MAIEAAATGGGTTVCSDENALAQCEGIIARGLTGSLANGVVLAVIRHKKLYRLRGHHSFGAYCAHFFGFSRAYAGCLIRAAGVLKNVNNCRRFSVLPSNEAQARKLARLSTDDQIVVWERIVASTPPDQITAQVVSNYVLAFMNDRADQTADEPDPDETALVDMDPTWHNSSSVRESIDSQIAAANEVDRQGTSVAPEPLVNSDRTATIAGEEDPLAPDRIELNERSFALNNPVAQIFATMADGREHSAPAYWPIHRTRLVAAFILQNRSLDAQRDRLSSARADVANAVSVGRETLSRAFEILEAAGVIQQSGGTEGTYLLSGPGMELAEARAAERS